MGNWWLLLPLVIGGIIAAFNTEGLNNSSEKVESWIRQAYATNSTRDGWFRLFVVRPILWLLVKFSDWTDSFVHRGIKNGVRIALTLYAILTWLYILFAAFMFIVVVAVCILILYIILKVMLNSNEDFRKGYNMSKRVIGSGGGGNTRVNPETGVIQKRGLLGWENTNQRIDPKTGKYQEEGLIGWNDTGRRVNQQSGIVQEEGLIGYNDTDTRIDPETGIIQKRGLLGWDNTDRRVDPETGKHQKRGLIGWIDEG